MDGEEDLETNPWFQALKKRCPDLFKRASAEGSIVCVPLRETIDGLGGLTKEIFEAHILRPSPFFAGVYEGMGGQTVDLEDQVIQTREGFAEKRKVRILFEELHYTADFKPFRVLCISQPLSGSVAKLPERARHRDVFSRPRTSLAECAALLDALALRDTAPLVQAAAEVRELFQCYVVARGFLDHARAKVDAIVDAAVARLVAANGAQLGACSADGRRAQALREAVETVLMDMGLHAQLCAALAAAHKEEDARCAAAMARLAEAAPAEVGADPAVRCDLGAAVAELRTLGGQPTPLDKVAVLRRAAAAVAEAVEAGRRSGSVPPDTALAQDDLLPLLIATVARARPPRLYSEACLVQHFAPGRAAGASGSGSEADFHAANLRAAADHLVGLAPRGAARPARAAPPAAPPRRSPPAGAASPAELLLPGLDGAPPRARAAAAPKHAPAGGGRAGAARAGAEPCGDMGWGVGGGGGGGGEPRARVLARGVAPAGGGATAGAGRGPWGGGGWGARGGAGGARGEDGESAGLGDFLLALRADEAQTLSGRGAAPLGL